MRQLVETGLVRQWVHWVHRDRAALRIAQGVAV
jgi:hypothetical protein